MTDHSTPTNPSVAHPQQAGHDRESGSSSSRTGNDGRPSPTPAATTKGARASAELPTTFTGAELDAMHLPPATYVVPGLLAEGMALLAARPKAGKSWMALHLGLTITAGGTFLDHDVEAGDVYYLALEDGHRRLRDRSHKLTKGAAISDRITFSIDAPKLDDGLMNDIEDWRKKATNPRLIIIDTLTNVMPSKKGRQNDYDAVNAALKELHRYALKYGLTILIVHHTRKAPPGGDSAGVDAFDNVLGSTGITAVVDTMLVLDQAKNQTDYVLHIRGRDIERRSLAVHFDPVECTWTQVDADPAAELAREQRAVYEAVLAGNTKLQDIETATGKSHSNVNNVLNILIGRGLVTREGRGRYSATAETPPETPPNADQASDKRDIDDIIAEFLAEADQDANTALPN